MAWWDIWLNKAKKAVKKVTETVSNIYTSIKKTVSDSISKVKEKVDKAKDYIVEEVREKTKKAREKVQEAEQREAEEKDYISELYINEKEIIKGVIRAKVKDPGAMGDMVYLVNTRDGRCISVLVQDVIKIVKTNNVLFKAMRKSCPLYASTPYIPRVRVDPSWKDELLKRFKALFKPKLKLVGMPQFDVISNIYEAATGKTLTAAESIKLKAKVMDYILPLNALSKLFFKKNLEGETEEFGKGTDYIDIAASLALIIPIGKLGAVAGKLGAKGFTKLFLTKSDDAIRLFSKLNVDDQGKLLAGLSKTDEGLDITSKLMGKGVVKKVTEGITPALFLKKPKQLTKWFTKQDSVTQIYIASKWQRMKGGPQALAILLRDVVKTKSTTWLRKSLKWIYVAIGAMTTVSFISFLYEEMMQTMGFGMWPLISNKLWSEANDYWWRAQPLLDSADWWYTYVGWMAPYSWDVFNNYMKATRMQYDSYKKVIIAKTGTFKDPSKDGKVFDKDEFKSNLAKGKAPDPIDLTVPIIEEEVEYISGYDLVGANIDKLDHKSAEAMSYFAKEVNKKQFTIMSEAEDYLFKLDAEYEEVTEEEEEEEIVEEIVEVPGLVPVTDIPEVLTSEQGWALTEAFDKIRELTWGAEVLSKVERDALIASFDMYTPAQKEVLDLLFQDLTYYTAGRDQLSADEFNSLKSKYHIEGA